MSGRAIRTLVFLNFVLCSRFPGLWRACEPPADRLANARLHPRHQERRLTGARSLPAFGPAYDHVDFLATPTRATPAARTNPGGRITPAKANPRIGFVISGMV